MEILNEYQQNELLKSLLEVYAARRASNSAYSLRAFSKKIGVSSGALSEIFQNKRRVTLKTARKILANLHQSPKDIEFFLETKKPNRKKKSREYQDFSLDQYHVLSNWHYLALLNLIDLCTDEQSREVFASRLDLPVQKIDESLKRLLRLGMIEEKKGRYFRTSIRYQTTEDIANSAIKKYHHETLALSEKALKEIEPALRDLSSIVLKMNPKNIKKVKGLIRNFQDEICELFENDDPTQVYHINVHLYPVTKNSKRETV